MLLWTAVAVTVVAAPMTGVSRYRPSSVAQGFIRDLGYERGTAIFSAALTASLVATLGLIAGWYLR